MRTAELKDLAATLKVAKPVTRKQAADFIQAIDAWEDTVHAICNQVFSRPRRGITRTEFLNWSGVT